MELLLIIIGLMALTVVISFITMLCNSSVSENDENDIRDRYTYPKK